MRKSTIYIFSIILLSCNTYNSTQRSSQESQELERFNKELLIEIEKDTIAAYALIADGNSRKETVILIKGYPGNDNNLDLGYELRENGFNVLLFDHRGAWGSQGEYLYSNCLEDVEYVIKYLVQPEISDNLRIDTNNFILIGRSLGGGVALIAGSQISRVKKIIGISNVNYGDLMQKHSDIAGLKNYSNYMQKQVMMNHNIDKFLTELIEHKREFNIVNYSEELSKKEVLLIEDSNKNDRWIKELKNHEIRYIDSDHNFTSGRKKMIHEIVQWLN